MYINKINHRLQEENEYVKKKIKQGSRICMCRHIGSRAGAGKTAFGAPSYRASSNKEEVKGRILVSGGPDISISYDKDGTVLEIKGIDRDGKNFLEGQEGYVGKSCKTAVGRLVRRLDEKKEPGGKG